jgi:hypothetical protein
MMPPTWMIEELEQARREREAQRPRLQLELPQPARGDAPGGDGPAGGRQGDANPGGVVVVVEW